MKKFNLMQIVPSLESGGVEQGTIDLANYLGDVGINSYIVSNGGKMLLLLNNRRVTHFKLPVHSKNFLMMPIVANKLNKIIKQNNIDIVHVRSRAPGWILKFIFNKNFKTVSTFHNIYGGKNFMKKFYNKSLSSTDHIVAISEYVKLNIIKKYKINHKKIKVINRGIDTNFFNTGIDDEDYFIKFLSKYQIDNNKKIILFPGRLTNWKGQLEFLKVVEFYKNKKVVFYFIGDNKNISYTSRLIKEINYKNLNNICRVFGHFSNIDLKIMYHCADLVISAPTQPEGFGRIISESLSMKKMILVYDYGGVKDQLKDLDDIFKIEPLNQTEMKKRIDIILNLSKEEIIKFGLLSREHVINNFSKQRMLDSYLNFYNEIL